jgi:hypothetical protein
MQRALDIDIAIKLDCLFIPLRTNARCAVNDGVHADQRIFPVSAGTDGFDANVAGCHHRLPQCPADGPAGAFQYRRKMPADETARSGYQHNRPIFLHETGSVGSGSRRNP